jgi:hypothetical protein
MPGDGPPPSETAAPRAELRDAPPLSTWPRIYAFVLGALVVEIFVCAALTAAYRP